MLGRPYSKNGELGANGNHHGYRDNKFPLKLILSTALPGLPTHPADTIAAASALTNADAFKIIGFARLTNPRLIVFGEIDASFRQHVLPTLSGQTPGPQSSQAPASTQVLPGHAQSRAPSTD